MRTLFFIIFVVLSNAEPDTGVLSENQLQSIVRDGHYAPFSSSGPYQPMNTPDRPI